MPHLYNYAISHEGSLLSEMLPTDPMDLRPEKMETIINTVMAREQECGGLGLEEQQLRRQQIFEELQEVERKLQKTELSVHHNFDQHEHALQQQQQQMALGGHHFSPGPLQILEEQSKCSRECGSIQQTENLAEILDSSFETPDISSSVYSQLQAFFGEPPLTGDDFYPEQAINRSEGNMLVNSKEVLNRLIERQRQVNRDVLTTVTSAAAVSGATSVAGSLPTSLSLPLATSSSSVSSSSSTLLASVVAASPASTSTSNLNLGQNKGPPLDKIAGSSISQSFPLNIGQLDEENTRGTCVSSLFYQPTPAQLCCSCWLVGWSYGHLFTALCLFVAPKCCAAWCKFSFTKKKKNFWKCFLIFFIYLFIYLFFFFFEFF